MTRDHIEKLLLAFEQSGRTVASGRDGQAMPPAIFSLDKLESLLSLKGDSGARKLLAETQLITGGEPVLMDIDTAQDLAKANIIYNKIS